MLFRDDQCYLALFRDYSVLFSVLVVLFSVI